MLVGEPLLVFHFKSNQFANLAFIIDHQIATTNGCDNLIGTHEVEIGACISNWNWSLTDSDTSTLHNMRDSWDTLKRYNYKLCN